MRANGRSWEFSGTHTQGPPTAANVRGRTQAPRPSSWTPRAGAAAAGVAAARAATSRACTCRVARPRPSPHPQRRVASGWPPRSTWARRRQSSGAHQETLASPPRGSAMSQLPRCSRGCQRTDWASRPSLRRLSSAAGCARRVRRNSASSRARRARAPRREPPLHLQCHQRSPPSRSRSGPRPSWPGGRGRLKA